MRAPYEIRSNVNVELIGGSLFGIIESLCDQTFESLDTLVRELGAQPGESLYRRKHDSNILLPLIDKETDCHLPAQATPPGRRGTARIEIEEAELPEHHD